ncbi:MAG: glycosyltransferase family 2 protein [Pseudomonadota bacterium]|nr:glycosyltransferase family 2 protein [Pseudomonadota bacterium]
MTLEPITPEIIAAACAQLLGSGDFPRAIADGLAANDPDKMRAAVSHLIDAGRVDGLRPLVERFRYVREFVVWARVTSSRLYRLAGDPAAALVDLDDLMANYPQRAAAHWWVGKAHCLEALGRVDEAETAAREGAQRFPDVVLPQAYLANLLSRSNRSVEALQVWRDIHSRFPDKEPGWYVGLANALKALGRRADAAAVLEDASRCFADDRRLPPLLAQDAEDRSQWGRALDLWDGYAARFDAAGETQVVFGRARALHRLDRIDEAIAALDRLIAREPGHWRALRERALLATELGEIELARDALGRLTREFAEASRPDWWGSLARAHHDLRDYDAGAAALAELERRFPESPVAAAERLRLAKELEKGQDDLTLMVEAALRRFPLDYSLRAHWVWILLGIGRLDLAERAVEALEAEGADGYALQARLRLESDRDDEAHVRAYVERLARERDWTAGDAVSAGDFLLGVRSPWAFALAVTILNAAAAQFPGHSRLRLLRIRALIAARDDATALALIDAIPQQRRRREELELRAWAQAQRGRHDEAKALWRETIATNYFAAVECPIDKLTRLTPPERLPPDGDVTAFIVFRNEAPQIPGFLAHHRRLGVKRFVFFDHMSDDDSRALLLAEPDVIVYDCPDSYQFSWSGRRWVNEIVAREGAKGWGLQLDADEHLIYPGCETVPIQRFVAYLDARGFEGVRGYMLDVYPRRLIGDDGQPAPFAEYRYYDDDYVLFGQERPPYLQPSGGVRARLFEAKEFLHKTPLWRLDAGLLINSHETTHLKFADVSAALLHYKMMNVVLRGRHAAQEAAGTAYVEADSSVDAMRRHSRYAARLAPLWRADLAAPGVTRELEPSLTLAERGLMDISDDFREWLAGEAAGR